MKDATIGGRRRSYGILLKSLGLMIFLGAACLVFSVSMIIGATLYFDYSNFVRCWVGFLIIAICCLVSWSGLCLLRKGGRHLGDKSNRGAIIGTSFGVLVFAVLFYIFAFPIVMLGAGISDAVARGGKYLDSLTPSDIQAWIERSKKIMAQQKAGEIPEGIVFKEKLPEDLKKLNINLYYVNSDGVTYEWVGGFDHTELVVEKKDDGTFQVTAQYDDEHSKVIWPKP